MKEVAGHKGEMFKINGKDAFRIDYRYGVGNGKLKGYNYLIETPDIRGGGYLSVIVLPDNEKDDIKKLIEEKDVNVIIESIKVLNTEKK